MSQNYVTFETAQLVVGDRLPGDLYVYVDGRFLKFRASGDPVDRLTFDRLEMKGVKHLFITEVDRPRFEAWVAGLNAPPGADPTRPIEKPTPFQATRSEVRRTAMDLFSGHHTGENVMKTLTASKKLVAEVMKQPYATKSLAQLQYFARGTVDHSVNVSVLSVYLANQMGYTHQLILNHIGTGGLLHDIGKAAVELNDRDTPEEAAKKMERHPELGVELLDRMVGVPSEVKMIVAQHHELHDGSGYPKKLRAAAIYDLARIVSMANIYDRMVADEVGTLPERQKAVVMKFEQVMRRKFEPQKLEKAMKILKLGV
jgi:putative nucleotidyltransferase with HDIG domain